MQDNEASDLIHNTKEYVTLYAVLGSHTVNYTVIGRVEASCTTDCYTGVLTFIPTKQSLDGQTKPKNYRKANGVLPGWGEITEKDLLH